MLTTKAYLGRATVQLDGLQLIDLKLDSHDVLSRVSVRVYVIDAEDSPRSDSVDGRGVLVASADSLTLSRVLLPIRFLVVSVFLHEKCASKTGHAPIILGQLCLSSADLKDDMTDRTEYLLYPPLSRRAHEASLDPTGSVLFSIRVTRDPPCFRAAWRVLGACWSSLRWLVELTSCATLVDRLASASLYVLNSTITVAQSIKNFKGRTHMAPHIGLLWMLLVALLGPLLWTPIALCVLVFSLAVVPVIAACVMAILVSEEMQTRVLPAMLDWLLSYKVLRHIIIREY